MKMEQPLLFEKSREEKLYDQVQSLKDSLDRVRKGQFAKIGALQKCYDDLKYEFELLKACICKTALHENEEKPTCEILEIPSMYNIN